MAGGALYNQSETPKQTFKNRNKRHTKKKRRIHANVRSYRRCFKACCVKNTSFFFFLLICCDVNLVVGLFFRLAWTGNPELLITLIGRSVSPDDRFCRILLLLLDDGIVCVATTIGLVMVSSPLFD